MRNYPHLGVQVPDVLLPRQGVDLQKWAVIAVDQFTSQPEYWQQVEETVGDAPSTYHLILPEGKLGTPEEPAIVEKAQAKMKEYLAQGLLESREGMVYVERTVDGKTRRGLIMALDLENYDYHKGSSTLIRATEGTILERIPPRMRIRRGAQLELPHILVLIDDPDHTVVEVAQKNLSSLEPLYDFELMAGSGHLRGFLVKNLGLEEQIIKGLEKLADPEQFRQKYGLNSDASPLLFAMGDGNHSLATAKAIWEELKPHVGMDHPARYALVEVENIHDEAMHFEPIHRVLFNIKADPLPAMQEKFGDQYRLDPVGSVEEMVQRVNGQTGPQQAVGVISEQGYGVITIGAPTSNLAVGTLQNFLDEFMEAGGAEKIDYVHGLDALTELGRKPCCVGFYLPPMPKEELFKTVILDGALPRKTFSMGEAKEKRFYMEARRIA